MELSIMKMFSDCDSSLYKDESYYLWLLWFITC